MRNPFSLPSDCTALTIDVPPVSGFIPSGFPICDVPDLTNPTLVLRAPRLPVLPINPVGACQCFSVTIQAVVQERKPFCPPITYPAPTFLEVVTTPPVSIAGLTPTGAFVPFTPVTFLTGTIPEGSRPYSCGVELFTQFYTIPVYDCDKLTYDVVEVTKVEAPQPLRFTGRAVRNADCCDPEVRFRFDMDVPCIPFEVTAEMRVNGYTFPHHLRMNAIPDTCEMGLQLDIPCMPLTFFPRSTLRGTISLTSPRRPELDIRMRRQCGTCAFEIDVPTFAIPCLPLTVELPGTKLGTILHTSQEPVLDIQLKHKENTCALSLDIPEFKIPCLPLGFFSPTGLQTGTIQLNAKYSSLGSEISALDLTYKAPAIRAALTRRPDVTCGFAITIKELEIPCLPLFIDQPGPVSGFVRRDYRRPRIRAELRRRSNTCALDLRIPEFDIPCLPLTIHPPTTPTGTVDRLASLPYLKITVTRLGDPGECAFGFTIENLAVPCLPLTIKQTMNSPAHPGVIRNDIDAPVIDLRLSRMSQTCGLSMYTPNLEIPCLPLTIHAGRNVGGIYKQTFRRTFRPMLTELTDFFGDTYFDTYYVIEDIRAIRNYLTAPTINLFVTKDPSKCEFAFELQALEIPCLPLTMRVSPTGQTGGTVDISLSKPRFNLSIARDPSRCEFSFRVPNLEIPCLPLTMRMASGLNVGTIDTEISKPVFNMQITRDGSRCEFSFQVPDLQIPCLPLTMAGSPTGSGAVNLDRSTPKLQVKIGKADDRCEFSLDIAEFEIPCLPLTIAGGQGNAGTGVVNLNIQEPVAKIALSRRAEDCGLSLYIPALEIPCLPLAVSSNTLMTGSVDLGTLERPVAQVFITRLPGTCQLDIGLTRMQIPRMPNVLVNPGTVEGFIDLAGLQVPEIALDLVRVGDLGLGLDWKALNIPRMPDVLLNPGVVAGVIDPAVLVPELDVRLERQGDLGLKPVVQNVKTPVQPRAIDLQGDFVGAVNPALVSPVINAEIKRNGNGIDLGLVVNKLEIPESVDITGVISGLSGFGLINGYSGPMTMVANLTLDGSDLNRIWYLVNFEHGLAKSRVGPFTNNVLHLTSCSP